MALANLLLLTTAEQLSQPCYELDRAKSKARRVASPIQALPGRSGRCRSMHRPTFMLQSVQRQFSELSSTMSWPRHGTLLWQVCWKCHHTYQGVQLSSHVGLCFLVFLWVNPTGMLQLPPMCSDWQCHPAVTAWGQHWDTR